MSRVIDTVVSVVQGPQEPALTVDYARRHLKALMHTDDRLIEGWINAAASFFEEFTGRPIIKRTYELWLDGFPQAQGRIELPYPPLFDVVSLAYVDGGGTLITALATGSPGDLAEYLVTAPQGERAEAGFIEPLPGTDWPAARRQARAVRVQYRAGYGDTADDVPEAIQAALCFMIGNYDQFRSAIVEPSRGNLSEVPWGLKTLLDGYKYSARGTTLHQGAEA